VATVDEIQRQKGSYKKAVEQIAARDFEGAFATLEKMGAFRELPKEEREQAVAVDYQAMARKGKSALVVSPTHAECENVTAAIRQTLKEHGEIKDGRTWNILRDLSLTAAEKSDARHYSPGLVVKINKPVKGFELGREMEVIGAGENGVWVQADGQRKELPLYQPELFSVFERDKIEVGQGERVRITANGRDMKGHRLNNGSLYTVKKFSRDGGLVLDNGFRLGKDFAHLAWGYASTSHAAQGKTVDCVLVCQSGLISSGATDAKQFYVSVSRGRKEVRIYTDDVAELRDNVTRERERQMATELIQHLGQEKQPIKKATVPVFQREEVIQVLRRRVQEEAQDVGMAMAR
jgi:hypothetical protein